MFRILENVDGTTSIFCKNSGNLLCTVPSKANSNGHQRINVVEPQPSNPKWPVYTINEAPTELPNEEKDDTPLTRKSLCRLSPIPISPDGDQSEDYSGECASQECFAKCLGLVATTTLHSTPREKLLAEWPLRLLSRSKAYRTNEPKDIKIPDQLPLTSCLGVRVLRLNEGRAFLSADRLKAQLRSYESFCRHPWNAACPTSCHFPKLRCREKKTYPIVVSGRVLRHSAHTHTYTRGRRQRAERERTRRTGLDARSRRLLRICSKRTLDVAVTPLPESEIRDWLSRRTATPPRHSDSEEEVEYKCDPSYRPSRRPAAGSRSRRDARINQWRHRTTIVTPKCSVYVRNVVMDIQRNRGAHYVKNTNIRVPFFRDFLASLGTNKPLLNAALHKANTIQGRGSNKTIDDICVLSSSRPRNACLSKTLPAKGMQKAKVSNKMTDDVSILPSSKTRSICLIKTVPQDLLSMSWPPERGTASQSTAGRGIESLKQRYAPLGRADLATKRSRPLYARSTELWNPELAAESDKSLFTIPPGYSSEFVWQKNSPRRLSPKSLPQYPPKTKQRAESWQKRAPRVLAPKPMPQSPPKAEQRAEVPRNSRGMFAKARRAGLKKSRVLKVDTDSSAFKRLLLLDPQKPLPDFSSDSEPIPVIDLTEETTPPRKTGSLKSRLQGTSVYMPEPNSSHRPGQSGQQAPSKGLVTTGHRPGPSCSKPGPSRSRAESSRQQVLKRPFFPMQQASAQAPEERFRVSQWRFRCFACGFQRLFFDRESPQSAEGAVRDHLSNYHNVGDVESYLSRYLDSVNHCAVIEAFPGFKGVDD